MKRSEKGREEREVGDRKLSNKYFLFTLNIDTSKKKVKMILQTQFLMIPSVTGFKRLLLPLLLLSKLLSSSRVIRRNILTSILNLKISSKLDNFE